MEDLIKQTAAMAAEVKTATEKIGLAKFEAERQELQKQMQEVNFWQDTARAQDVSRREADLARRTEPWQKLQKELDELLELVQLGDAKMTDELQEQFSNLQSQFSNLKEDLKFSGPYDDHDVVLAIYAGAGGTDAQDWAEMLLRMYLRYVENQKLKAKVVDQSAGEEAGIKSATIELTGGNFLYGKLAGEHGVHRLVRLSPFNADHKRQTSFAKVEILPLMDKPGELELDAKDLKIDVFRASGKGGQSVNTTDSAVRVMHLPTSISVAIQNERSQLQNKETAISILRSKLVQLQLEQHSDNLSQLKGPSQSAEWGNQIRSYVLHPYKQVKDLRTGYETTDPEKILDGHLDSLINAWLEKQ